MGEVFRAYDANAARLVAIKVVRAGKDGEVQDLRNEIRLLSRLRHEGIVRLLDVGLWEDRVYLVMELVHGATLAALATDHPAPRASEVRWLLPVTFRILDALDYIHSRGWVHGDLKPANVLVETPEGAPPTALAALAVAGPGIRLLDFGLARWVESSPSGAEGPGGTIPYMAPELLDGTRRADARADLYSLGAVIYRLVAGRPPFSSLGELRSWRPAPRPPSQINPDCPREVSDLILRLLDRHPHRRPASARAAQDAVLAILDPEERRAALTPRLLPPVFVGREKEIAALRTALGRAAEGKGSWLQVVGDAGAGKTWLLEQSGLRSEAAVDLGMGQARGAFRRGGSIFEGLRGVLGDVVDILLEGRPDSIEPELRRWIASLRDAFHLEIPNAGGWEAAPSPFAVEDDPSSSRAARERIVTATVEVLREAGRRRPLLITIEDLQNADATEIRLIESVAKAIPTIPAVLVVTYRSEEAAGGTPLGRWIAGLDAAGEPPPVVLGSLADDEVRELAESMLRPAGAVGPEVVDLLSERSAGRPSSIVRQLRALWERAALTNDGGVWALEADADARTCVTADWPSQIRNLSPEELRVLAATLVLAAPADAEILHLMGEGDAALTGHRRIGKRLGELVRKGLLTAVPEGFLPPSDLDEKALRGFVSPAELAALHSRAARALGTRYAKVMEPHAHLVAEHLVRAGETGRAIEYFLRAARYAARVFANHRGIDAYHRAMDLCHDDALKHRIAEELGELHTRIGEYPVALESFRLAESLAAKEGGGRREPAAGDVEIDLLDKIGRVLHRQGELAEALAVFSRCLERSEDRPPGRAKALFRIGGVHLDRGDAQTARRHLEESLRLYRELGDHRQMAAAQSGLGIAEKIQGRLDRAIVHFEDALENAEEAGDLLDVATTLNNLGNIHRALGHDREAIDCFRRSIDVRRRVGDRQGLAICFNNVARVHSFRGEIQQARVATENALSIFREVGDKKGVVIARSNLGELAQIQGDFATARTHFLENLESSRALGVQRLFETNLCNLADLELEMGNYPEAVDLATRCLSGLPDEPPLDLRAQALGTLSGGLLAQGLLEEAHERLREALEIAGRLELKEKLGVLAGYRIRLCIQQGDPEAALAVGKTLLARVSDGSDRYSIARFHREMGRVYRDLGPDWADLTEKHLSSSLHDFESMGSIHNAALTRVELGLYWRLQGEDEEADEHFGRALRDLAEVGLVRKIEEVHELRRAS